MDNMFRYRRMLLPKRSAELVALVAISCTFFLYLHTQTLTTRLREMEDKLQPSMVSSSGLTGNSINQVPDNTHLQPPSNNFANNMYQHLKSTGEMNTISAWDLNNTRRAGYSIVFFNRVPKVGSQTFMELFRRLSDRNGFTFARDAVQRVETIRLMPDQQLELAEKVATLPTPSIYVKHVCHTNFTRFGLPTPIYVNIVRDPIERVISWYYYVRAPWYYVERKQAFPDLPLPDPRWLRKDFESCVLEGDHECTYEQGATHDGIGDHRRQSLFFCGHEPECTPFNSVGALERAKYAVESQYSVVGVLEDFNITLSVFEKYVPQFFRGATQVYAEGGDYFHKINKNVFKPPVSERVKDIVRKNFTREIEFYQFCRQRLHKQYLAVNLPLK